MSLLATAAAALARVQSMACYFTANGKAEWMALYRKARSLVCPLEIERYGVQSLLCCGTPLCCGLRVIGVRARVCDHAVTSVTGGSQQRVQRHSPAKIRLVPHKM